ncbi:MAG TPA: DUF4159 domain-containing protein [Candidatus Saccharimonadales bacterium]|nr:DUF4159 domain-containing protein [Candidatus Saccharimonadales bacterium]
MNCRKYRVAFPLFLTGLLAAAAFGQYESSYRGDMRTAREMESHSTGTPEWKNPPAFKKDVFTFVRIKYTRGRRGWGSAGYWITDAPDSDLNLSFRLQQMTSMKVDPDGRFLELTDPELFNYPFIYIVEPGGLRFEDEEVVILRRYLLSGGFLMVDDFWGEAEWDNFYEQIRRVFPDREPVELPLEHPLFHCVFDIVEKPQVPNVRLGIQSQYTGVTWERSDARVPHYRAILDDKGRIMVMACHNTDLGDGWEREGENEYYFREFSEKKAFPLGINIIFYAMTH